MFENLTDRLSKTLRKMVGRKLTDENMRETLSEVKKALLEADVALEVVKKFVKEIKDKARGLEVGKLSPAQAVVKLVNDELVAIMGEKNERLDFQASPPAIILMAGLQGSGKTTSSAKLAKLLIEREKKKVVLASADVYRPAAIDQLQTLSAEVAAVFHDNAGENKPVQIAKDALETAKKQHADVLIIDTAGRLHIDTEMMDEIQQIHQTVKPVETLFVVDGMTGQDAANTAKAFDEALPLTGVVVTKLDGDARGGAILSIREITGGKPIKFIGMGEKTDALEPFHPDRMASRILGMGDILSLVEQLERDVDQDEAKKLSKKLERGQGFNLDDFKSQLLQMEKLGGMTGLMDKLPGMGNLPDAVKDKANDKHTGRILAMINSMTAVERKRPQLIQSSGSRKRRIATGSGTSIQDVARLLKQFGQMQKMMKKMSGKGGKMKMMKQMKDMLPPGSF